MRLIGAALAVFLSTLAVSTMDFTALAQQNDEQAATIDGLHIGRAIFRFDTFGDEQLWTRFLRMHEALGTVDPATALAVGLKVDVDALPPELIEALKKKEVDLTDPAVTRDMLR